MQIVQVQQVSPAPGLAEQMLSTRTVKVLLPHKNSEGTERAAQRSGNARSPVQSVAESDPEQRPQVPVLLIIQKQYPRIGRPFQGDNQSRIGSPGQGCLEQVPRNSRSPAVPIG